jgi:hypothetical protein
MRCIAAIVEEPTTLVLRPTETSNLSRFRGESPMRSSLFLICCLTAILSTTTVFADKALPNEAPPPAEPQAAASEPVRLIIRKDVGAKTSRIIIPAKFVPGGVAGEKVGALSPTRSVIAGLALSAAIAGVFIVARRGNRKAVAVVVLGVIAAGAVTSAVADIRVPDEPEAKSQIIIEVVADGDEVVLIQGADFGR